MNLTENRLSRNEMCCVTNDHSYMCHKLVTVIFIKNSNSTSVIVWSEQLIIKITLHTPTL